jgi:hypothetical protein
LNEKLHDLPSLAGSLGTVLLDLFGELFTTLALHQKLSNTLALFLFGRILPYSTSYNIRPPIYRLVPIPGVSAYQRTPRPVIAQTNFLRCSSFSIFASSLK